MVLIYGRNETNIQILEIYSDKNMHLIGVEPTHMPPEGTALSTELQVHDLIIIHQFFIDCK